MDDDAKEEEEEELEAADDAAAAPGVLGFSPACPTVNTTRFAVMLKSSTGPGKVDGRIKHGTDDPLDAGSSKYLDTIDCNPVAYSLPSLDKKSPSLSLPSTWTIRILC